MLLVPNTLPQFWNLSISVLVSMPALVCWPCKLWPHSMKALTLLMVALHLLSSHLCTIHQKNLKYYLPRPLTSLILSLDFLRCWIPSSSESLEQLDTWSAVLSCYAMLFDWDTVFSTRAFQRVGRPPSEKCCPPENSDRSLTNPKFGSI